MKNNFMVTLFKTLLIVFIISNSILSQENVTEEKKREVQKKVDNLNKIIKQKGLKWKAGVTSISYLTEAEFRKISSGDLEENDIKTKREKKSFLNKVQTIPDWRSLMSGVQRQEYNNCWAYAVTGVAEGVLHYYYGSNIKINLDEMVVTDNNNCGSDRNGGTPNCGLSFIRDYKVPSESGINSFPNYDNAYYSINSMDVDIPTTPANIKNELLTSPVYASMEVFTDFQGYTGGIYSYATGTSQGYHAVVIVGYNDTEGYWICKNSWGTNWGDDGYFKIAYGECGIDTRKCGTATVTSEDCFAKISPSLIPDINNAFSYSLVDNEYIYVLSGSYSLTQSKTISSTNGIVINSGSSINLNGRSIISTGGTIIKQTGVTINGLHATLVEGDTPFATKAVCGTVQAAVTAATTDDNIYIEDGPFNESISISGKNSLRIREGVLTGNITVTNSDDLYIYHTQCSGIYMSNCDEPWFNGTVRVYGSGSGTGMSLFNVNVGYSYGNGNVPDSKIVVYNFSTGLYTVGSVFSMVTDVYPSWLKDQTDGVSANYSSNIYLNDVNLCGITRYHLASYTGSYIEALACQYDNATPVINQSGGTITYNYPSACGAFKISTTAASTSDEIDITVNDDEFGKINNRLNKISRQIKAEYTEGKSFNRSTYKEDFLSVGNQFKEFIKNNTGSKYKGVAVTTAIHCYKAVKDYEAMKEFIDEIKSDEEVGKYAERFMIDYYQKQGAYEKALSVADELLEKADDDLAITLLYLKGLVYGHDMDKPEEAIKCFAKIVKDYPDDGMADMALNQLSIFGVNELKEVASEDVADNENLEISLTNSPNPFNPTTTISYQLPEAGFVTLKVFDMLGREVASLVNNKMEAGKYSANFNASNLASGIYIYRITVQSFEGSKDFFTQSNKMLLLK